jgi:hypothetical protein
LVENGREFSTEELQAAFAQVLAESDGDEREVIKAAINALLSSEMLIDPFGLVEALRAVSKWFVPRKLSTRCSCLMAFQ